VDVYAGHGFTVQDPRFSPEVRRRARANRDRQLLEGGKASPALFCTYPAALGEAPLSTMADVYVDGTRSVITWGVVIVVHPQS
jgi:hypothetical protein